MRLSVSLSLLLLLAPLAAGAKDTAKESIKADPSLFPAQRAEIEKSIKTDKYSELTLTQREKVAAALDRMEAILASADSIAALEEEKKIELFNDQELINNLLTKAREDSRLVCARRVKTGSHRPTTECRTVGERRRDRLESQDALREHQRSLMPVQGGDS